MIRWCAYCQRYQGEVEPLDDYSVTHTLCEACEARGAFWQPQPESLKAIAAFFTRVARAGTQRDLDAAELVAQGTALGLDPVDLLLGIVQPVLRQIGERWARSEATVAEEHRVTALCSAVVQSIVASEPGGAILRNAPTPAVLLVVAEGNYHTLGVQVLEVILLRHRVATHAVYPGLPAAEVVTLARSLRPRVVALSAALPQQLAGAVTVAERLAKLPLTERPVVVAGGRAAQGQAPLPAGCTLRLCGQARELVELATRSYAAVS